MTTDSVVSLDLRFRPGEGVLVRHRGLALLVGSGADDTTAGLLIAARSAARSRQPGLRLVQSLTDILTSGERLPPLCAVGVVRGGTAVMAHGAATVTVHTGDGAVSVNGHDAATTVVERRVTGRVSAVEAALGADTGPSDPWCELASGVVRADAFSMGTGPAVPTEAPATGTTTLEVATEISGVRCRAGHFNDPAMPYCCVCGLGLTQAGRVCCRGGRPTLGVLVVDDGRVLPLDKDCLLGRAPYGPEVRAGAVTAVSLDDPLVSDVHARIGIEGWDVRVWDTASSRGTYVRQRAADVWERLGEGQRRRLEPGAVIAIGGRQVRFDTYRIH